MGILGYIVQYANEDDYTVYHGYKKLFRHFSECLQHAKEVYQGYCVEHPEEHDGPFQVHTPTKKMCDNQGSVVVFESRGMIVWIDCVVE
jgi:hypothetical protein